MQIRIDRAAFLRGLYFAQSIADRKSTTTPAVANVLLRTQGPQSVLCAATDLRTSVVAEVAAEVQKEGGVSVGAKHLYEIVRSLPDTDVVLRKTENNSVEITASKARYRLVGMTDRDFPRLPDHREVPYKEIHAPTLAEMITKTIFSVSTDDTRQHLAGIFLESDGQQMTMVSTDGHRLTKVQREVGDGPKLERGLIIPRKGVTEMRRLVEGVEGTCDFGFAQGHAFVKANDVVLAVTLIDANFPPYDQVIPRESDKQLVLPRATFLEALRRASIMSSERSWGVRMELTAGRLRITSDNPDLGEAEEDIDVEYQGPELTVGFNARYFMDVVSEIREDRVCLELNGELDPGLVRPYDLRDYLGVVMPMRI